MLETASVTAESRAHVDPVQSARQVQVPVPVLVSAQVPWAVTHWGHRAQLAP